MEERKTSQNAKPKQAGFTATLTENAHSEIEALEKRKKEAAKPIYLIRC